MGGKHTVEKLSPVTDPLSTASKQSRRSWLHNSGKSKTLRKDDALIVEIMMPLYYTEERLRFQDVYDARVSWDMIMKDCSPQFDFERFSLPFATCREWFEHLFYERLFDIHPFSKKMFKDPSTQGKFLVSLFSFVFTVMDDEDKFNVRLMDLADSHCKRGVKSSEYAIIGEVMFWTLKRCLGPGYDSKTHTAWVKIFSKMLKVIVPISITHELENNEAQVERVNKFNNSTSPKSMRDADVNKDAPTCPFMPNDAPVTEDIIKTKISIKDSIFRGNLSVSRRVGPLPPIDGFSAIPDTNEEIST